MAGSNNSIFVFDEALSDFTIRKGIGDAGIGSTVAPLVSSNSINGVWFNKNRQRVGSVNPRRAPGEYVKRTEVDRNQRNQFFCVDRSIIKSVPNELVEGQGEAVIFDELTTAAQDALNEIVHAHESDVYDALWGTAKADFDAIYGASQVVTPGTKWDAAGATIREDVITGIDTAYKRCGYRPNTVVVTKEVINAIASDSSNEIAERLKYTSGRVPTEELLAQYFGVQRVVVPQDLDDSANPGQDANYDFLWSGDHVGIYYIDPSNSRNKETLASTFTWSSAREPLFGSFTRYNEDNKSHEVRVSAYYDVQTIDAACGYVLYDVLT